MKRENRRTDKNNETINLYLSKYRNEFHFDENKKRQKLKEMGIK